LPKNIRPKALLMCSSRGRTQIVRRGLDGVKVEFLASIGPRHLTHPKTAQVRFANYLSSELIVFRLPPRRRDQFTKAAVHSS
jgi:hypothetical protein